MPGSTCWGAPAPPCPHPPRRQQNELEPSMMKRFVTFLFLLAVLAGLAWWQRAAVVPFVASHAPVTKAWFDAVPALAALTKPQEGGQADGALRGGGRRGNRAGPVAVVVAAAQTKDLPVTIDAVGAAN